MTDILCTNPTSTPIEWAMNPRTEKIANPETIEAPELKPERIMHHLYELKENLLYEPFLPFKNHIHITGIIIILYINNVTLLMYYYCTSVLEDIQGPSSRSGAIKYSF